MNLRERMAEVLTDLDSQADRAGTAPAGLAWTDAARMVRTALNDSLHDDAEGFDAGVRQAVEWLRGDYEYGTGPQWREDGCEWIRERLSEHLGDGAGLAGEA